MAEVSTELKPLKPTPDSTENPPSVNGGDVGVKRRLLFLSEKDFSAPEEPNTTCSDLGLQSFSDDSNSRRLSTETAEQSSPNTTGTCLTVENVIIDSPDQHKVNTNDDKENAQCLDISQGR